MFRSFMESDSKIYPLNYGGSNLSNKLFISLDILLV